jgi:hypothetical protein
VTLLRGTGNDVLSARLRHIARCSLFLGEQELNTIGKSLRMYKVCIPLTAPLAISFAVFSLGGGIDRGVPQQRRVR